MVGKAYGRGWLPADLDLVCFGVQFLSFLNFIIDNEITVNLLNFEFLIVL